MKSRILRHFGDVDPGVRSYSIKLSRMCARRTQDFAPGARVHCRDRRAETLFGSRLPQPSRIFAGSLWLQRRFCGKTNSGSADAPAIIHQQRNHAESSVTLTMTFTNEQIEVLKRAKELCAHEVPDANWAAAVVCFAQKSISPQTATPSPAKPATVDTSRRSITGGRYRRAGKPTSKI